MGYDNRFPHMIPLDGRPTSALDAIDLARAASVGRAIAGRTQTVPFFNTITRGIFFARTQTPNIGPYEMPERNWRIAEAHHIDSLVSYINLSLIPPDVKDRWEKGHENREKIEKERRRAARTHDRRHDIEDYAAFLSRKRRGTQTTVQVL